MFVTGEAVFATANLPVYWKSTTGEFSNAATVGYYKVGYSKAPIASGVLDVNFIQPSIVASEISELEAVVTNITELSGRPFRKTVVLTSAASATPVEIIADAEVTGTQKVYITDLLMYVSSTVAWTDSTGTVVTVQDTNSSAVVAATAAKAQLTSEALLGKLSTGITLGDAIKKGSGLTAAKGIVVVADSDFDAGSDLYVTVTGYIQ
jgi:hypothetical protein